MEITEPSMEGQNITCSGAGGQDNLLRKESNPSARVLIKPKYLLEAIRSRGNQKKR
jgi:hypothetical protein